LRKEERVFTPRTKEITAFAAKYPDRVAFLQKILTDRSIVYIDFGNVSHWSKRLGWQIDLRKLKDFLDSFGVGEIRFYYGTLDEEGSRRFMSFVHKVGYKIRTKPVKIMQLSIDVTSISKTGADILSNFINGTLLKNLRLEVIQYLNEELRSMNRQGIRNLECRKCNFDVEIATDMRIDHFLKRADNFCLWSGDSDFSDPLIELLNDHKKVCVVGTARMIASEINELKARGLQIFDVQKLRDVLEDTR
jgi:uncharacterized LabA/DUF88 family protein